MLTSVGLLEVVNKCPYLLVDEGFVTIVEEVNDINYPIVDKEGSVYMEEFIDDLAQY